MLACAAVRTPAQVRRLTSHLNSLREQIDSEKGLQERILREFRQQVGRGGSSKACVTVSARVERGAWVVIVTPRRVHASTARAGHLGAAVVGTSNVLARELVCDASGAGQVRMDVTGARQKRSVACTLQLVVRESRGVRYVYV